MESDGDAIDVGETTYTYDSTGVRTSQSTRTHGTVTSTTTYLNDPSNPTGHAKAVEERTGTTGIASGTLTRSYTFGRTVLTQTDSQGTTSLLTDGGGSTRALVGAAGQLPTASYTYDAFGDALGFDPGTARTPWLFGGDGLHDPASGWTYHLARYRDSQSFTSRDPVIWGVGDLSDANLYQYAAGNPEMGRDPTGMFVSFTDILVSGGLNSILASIQGTTGQILMRSFNQGLVGAIVAQAAETATAIAIGSGASVGLYVLGRTLGWAGSSLLTAIRAHLATQAKDKLVKSLMLIRVPLEEGLRMRPITPGNRSDAARLAWIEEVELIRRSGRGTRDWTVNEIERILDGARPQDLGYTGHHINRVKDKPEWAGDPRNIAWLKAGAGEEHMVVGHPGGTNSKSHSGGLLIDRQAMLNSLGVVAGG